MVRITLDRKAGLEPVLTKFYGQSPCPSADGKSIAFCTIPRPPEQQQ